MGKKNNVPAASEAASPAKKQLELVCLHGACAGQAHGRAVIECESWEIPVYLMVHHFNHEGHKTEVRIDGTDYHRLPTAPPAPAAAPGETVTTIAVAGGSFRWGA